MTNSAPSAAAIAQPKIDARLRGHLPALDAIRGLAIIAVTLFRFAVEEPLAGPRFESALFRPFNLGVRGVDLFFVLSGFLITGILYDAKGTSDYFSKFYWRRTLRIFPLYYGVLLLTLIAMYLAPVMREWKGFHEAHEMMPWLFCYGTNIRQSLAGEFTGGAFSHFWSLAVEEHFYLVWPLVIFLCSRKTAIGVCSALVVGAAALRIGVIRYIGSEQADVVNDVLTICRVDQLALGAMLALAVRGPHGIEAVGRWITFGMIGSFLVLVPIHALNMRAMSLPYTLWGVFFAGMIYHAIVAGSHSRLKQLCESRVLRFFGKYSYGMYVFQKPLIYLMPVWLSGPALVHTTGSFMAGKLIYMAVMCVLTTLAALVSWHAFEKHFLAWKDCNPLKTKS